MPPLPQLSSKREAVSCRGADAGTLGTMRAATHTVLCSLRAPWLCLKQLWVMMAEASATESVPLHKKYIEIPRGSTRPCDPRTGGQRGPFHAPRVGEPPLALRTSSWSLSQASATPSRLFLQTTATGQPQALRWPVARFPGLARVGACVHT